MSPSSTTVVDTPPTGFDFEHSLRNAFLEKAQAMNAQQRNAQSNNSTTSSSSNNNSIKLVAKKTGTTICGCIYKDGVVLGADTRATNGTEVAEKNCTKIHYMAPNIYCCGAGTAADTEQTTALIASQLELLRMETHSSSRVVTAATLLKRMLYRYQGHISAALVLGGVDSDGTPSLYQIYPHGSTSNLPYTTMGSGSLAAMSVFESSWTSSQTMSEETCVNLVQRAIGAGIFNDLGSGSNVDICIIRSDQSVDYRRNCITPNEIGPLRAQIQRSTRLQMTPGLTPILHTSVQRPATLNDVQVQDMEVEE